MTRKLGYFTAPLCLIVMALFIANADRYVGVFFDGVTLWATSVLPAILPFMIFSGIVSESGGLAPVFTRTKLTKIFNAPKGSDYVWLLSLLCGYPIGAKLIAERYERGASTTQCAKLATFCSTAGPLFLVGAVGLKLGSNSALLVLTTSHYVGSLLCGILFRNSYSKDQTPLNFSPITTGKDSSTVLDSVLAVLNVGALIAVFHLLCDMLYQVLPQWFATDGQLLTAYLMGLMEMTNGCFAVCSCADTFTATVLCCSLVSFGGLCVMLQCMTFFEKCKIKIGAVATFKASQCAVSTIVCFLLGKIFI